jgi:hypothetical protein
MAPQQDADIPRGSVDAAQPRARRLPGKARPRDDVLREYMEGLRRRRDAIDARWSNTNSFVLYDILAPDESAELYRWRVQLDCGCIKEAMTRGDNTLPHEVPWTDHVYYAQLPVGQVVCHHDDHPESPYRKITDWDTRSEHTLPADPAEPPDWVMSASEKTGNDPADFWAALRHNEPGTTAMWRVTLECGHVTEVSADVDWNPTDGPRRTSAQRLREMRAEMEEDEDEPSPLREHMRRMLDEGWPMPQTETTCFACTSVRRFVAYQRVGWLVPRQTKPRPSKPSRESLTRRLSAAEAEAQRLRDQLAQHDADQEP